MCVQTKAYDTQLLYDKLEQEALLPQTDRATSCFSRYLVNCCTTVGTSCTANSQQIKVMELEGYG